MIWILTLGGVGLAIIALALFTMFMGHGHLDAHNSESQHLDEIEVFSRNFHL